ncbi:FecR domain-containing protein, partial [Chloroflexota bacterium]
MGTIADISKILDECILRISSGEIIETCLDEHPNLREQLKPLLSIAQSISNMPKVTPSDEFRRVSKNRLMMRIREEPRQAKAIKSSQRIPLLSEIAVAWQRFLHANIATRKVAILVAITLLLALGANLYGVFYLLPQPPALDSQCTLSIISGSVEIQSLGSDTGQQATDGMILNVGTRVKTAPNSHALLTFFEGTTTKLEPNTDVELQQLGHSDEQSATIVLKQWLGRTWSRVIKMADPGSQYEIKTPSATAVVRGTLFATDVDKTGSTQVTTTEGLVSVIAQEEEVYLTANQQSGVEAG